MDQDENEGVGIIAGTILILIIVFISVVVATIIAGVAIAGEVSQSDPQVYEEFIVTNLGVPGELTITTTETSWVVETPNENFREVESAIRPFYTTYWNGGRVLFFVPAEVWSAAIAAYQKYSWCDPRFIVALAHSESSVYNNSVCSYAGACGTWQFMPGTWANLWKGVDPIPERTNRYAAAEAACRYTKGNGMIDALGSKTQFVYEFATEPPVWNMYPPQAEYVWELYQTVKLDDQVKFPEFSHSGPIYQVDDTWWKQPIIWLLKAFHLWPETLAFRQTNSFIAIPSAEGDHLVALPEQGGTITYELHGQNYGHCAIDISGGNGTIVTSPINGIVTQKFVDGYGNPTLWIENSLYVVKLLHGNWTPKVGDQLMIGQSVGTESNKGLTGWIDDYGEFQLCGTGSTCGYHVHFSLERKGQECVNPQTLVNWPENKK